MEYDLKFMPDEFQEKLLKYDGTLMSLGTQRRDIIRKRLIQVFEKKKLTPQDTDLATYYMEEYDKAEKFTRKAMASVQKRMEYLTKLYKEETAASKRRTEQLSKKGLAVAVLRRRVRLKSTQFILGSSQLIWRNSRRLRLKINRNPKNQKGI